VINVGTLAELDREDNFIRRLKHADMFGEECLLPHALEDVPLWEVSLTVIERCECLVIIAADLVDAFIANPKSKGKAVMLKNLQTMRDELKRKYNNKELTYNYKAPTSASLKLGKPAMTFKQAVLLKRKVERERTSRNFQAVLGANKHSPGQNKAVARPNSGGRGGRKNNSRFGELTSFDAGSGRSFNRGSGRSFDSADGKNVGSGGGGGGSGMSSEEAAALIGAVADSRSRISALTLELQVTRAAAEATQKMVEQLLQGQTGDGEKTGSRAGSNAGNWCGRSVNSSLDSNSEGKASLPGSPSGRRGDSQLSPLGFRDATSTTVPIQPATEPTARVDQEKRCSSDK
jgi:hypothetical protein